MPKVIASHFEPLHEMLIHLSTQSDAAWTEGGMVWSFEFQKRLASTLKVDGNYVARSKVKSHGTNLLNYKISWEKLIWKAQGDLGNLMNLAGGPEWDDEENRLIGEREDQAEWVIKFFETSSADQVRMFFIEDDTSMSVKCVSLFGRDALIHKILWSID